MIPATCYAVTIRIVGIYAVKASILALVVLSALATPAQAEVKPVGAEGFVVRREVVVTAGADAVWDRLVRPAMWWSSGHTFSQNSANLTLDATAGGCFCEALPVGQDRARAGSVQHMAVLFADPGKVLRMSGALGPLQGEAANGVMTITLTGQSNGTAVVMEYVVGGTMRLSREQIGPAVDNVLGEQLTRLAQSFAAPAPTGDVSQDFLSGVEGAR